MNEQATIAVKTMKTRQTIDNLDAHLKEQLEFLKLSSNAYDEGFKGEAKRLAVTIRTLVHDTARSQSLLSQLKIKNNLRFYDTAFGCKPNRAGSHTGLIMIRATVHGGEHVPHLDSGPPRRNSFVTFPRWWDKKEVIVDKNQNNFTRKDLILALANKDGGAHIDPKLDESYFQLTRNNSVGWQFIGPDTVQEEVAGAADASVRQISYELQISIECHLAI